MLITLFVVCFVSARVGSVVGSALFWFWVRRVINIILDGFCFAGFTCKKGFAQIKHTCTVCFAEHQL